MAAPLPKTLAALLRHVSVPPEKRYGGGWALTPQQTSRAASGLLRRGLITTDRRGYYVPTDAGWEALDECP